MKEIREVILFSHGDSEQLSTWSNVPYFFAESLMAKGIKVHRVDINPASFFEKLYDHTVWRVLNKLKKGYFNTYLRTYINHTHVRSRIKKAIRKYKNADAHIFLSFSHSSSGLTDKPVVLFCDWTIEYYFKYFLNRKPLFIEKYPMKRQDKIIEDADLVISLFPRVTEHMKTYYKNPSITYLGNVVNSALTVDLPAVIKKKSVSKDILFIGNMKYFSGAVCLIKAFELLRQKIGDVKLHIIGMEKDKFEKLPGGVTCYGYLDKSNDESRALYYSLLENAKVVVNTTEKWGAFSSTIEAMYFATPVITSPYAEFTETFGQQINFGFYCESNAVEPLRDALVRLFEYPSYEQFCRNAHDAVEQFSWGAYMDKVLAEIKKL